MGGGALASCGRCAECSARVAACMPTLPPITECTPGALKPFLEVAMAHPSAVYLQYQAVSTVGAGMAPGVTCMC